MDADEAEEAGGIPAFDMEFGGPEEEGPAEKEKYDDEMIGFLRSLNIIDVNEIFSPPRVVRQCEKFGLKAGNSMDLMTGWDFDLEADKARAKECIRRDKPTLVIGSPPCTYFSTLQELNKHNMRHDAAWMSKFNENLNKAIRHIIFCVEVYWMQMAEGRFWLHEHPWSAKS